MSERTLTYNFTSIQKRITSPAYVYGVSSSMDKSIAVEALWDTGAMISVISTQVMRDLKLVPMGTKYVRGVGGVLTVPIVLIAIELPRGVLKKDCTAVVADAAPNIDLIIGMDIITLGDFSLLSGNNHTLFSFTTRHRGYR